MWNTHNWMCHKEVLGHGDEIWALTVVGDKLVSGSIDRYWMYSTLIMSHACMWCGAIYVYFLPLFSRYNPS